MATTPCHTTEASHLSSAKSKRFADDRTPTLDEIRRLVAHPFRKIKSIANTHNVIVRK